MTMKIKTEGNTVVTKHTKHMLVNKFKRNLSGWLLVLPAVLCVYFFIIRPQALGTYWSFFEMNGYKVGEFAGLANYKRILSDTMFFKTLWNTCLYVFWSLVVGFLIPIVLAVMMNELVHLRKTIRFCVYLPNVLPATAVMTIWYFMFYPDQGGLLNMILSKFGIEPYGWLQDSDWTILYIVITMTWNGAGATAIYYFAALQGINRELYEATLIDGAGFFRRMFTVTLPHIYGIVLLFLVQQIINVFSIMEQPLQMTDGGPNGASMTLGLLSYRYGFVSVRPNLAMAVGVIMFIILMIMTCFYFILDKKVQDNL